MEWIIVLFVCLVLVGLVFMLRQRREAQRTAEHERAQAFLMSLQGAAFMPEAPQPNTETPSVGPWSGPFSEGMPAVRALGATIEPPAASGRRPGYLDHRHQVVWRWLRTGLPETEIFARGSLRRVVGRERVQKDMMLDFVICNAQFEVLAAVDLEKSGQADPGARFKQMLLEEAGVLYANWNAAQLPDQSALRRWLDRLADPARPDQMTR